MNSLLFMIPISLFVVVGAAAAFFWAVNHDQFDDLDAGSHLPMHDDPADTAPEPTATDGPD